ncbi:hypothetical protein [Bacillus thuringiensis]|uniref:Uncharacterized protein n=1 Tax=Bacillus thuringiensis TaxID=1428 RepID=A0A9X6VCA7_BACTU|nr:hypothetical protein [Bacillus thuringiensis]MEC3269820.1 hypothetical protein [Bacillus thuringiensis]PFB07891.1 hypothetical protein CN398_09140 [Bacillus thuringiensis]
MTSFKKLQFVTTNGENIGIITDIESSLQANDTEIYVFDEETDGDFGGLVVKEKTVRLLTEEEIQERLDKIKSDYQKYAYFIIGLNNMKKLKKYHILENEFVQQARIDSTHFSKGFKTTQSDLLKHNGKSFTVLRMLTVEEADIEDVGRIYKIQLSSGEILDAFEDEIVMFPSK